MEISSQLLLNQFNLLLDIEGFSQFNENSINCKEVVAIFTRLCGEMWNYVILITLQLSYILPPSYFSHDIPSILLIMSFYQFRNLPPIQGEYSNAMIYPHLTNLQFLRNNDQGQMQF